MYCLYYLITVIKIEYKILDIKFWVYIKLINNVFKTISLLDLSLNSMNIKYLHKMQWFLKYVHKSTDTLPFKKWSLILLRLWGGLRDLNIMNRIWQKRWYVTHKTHHRRYFVLLWALSIRSLDRGKVSCHVRRTHMYTK